MLPLPALRGQSGGAGLLAGASAPSSTSPFSFPLGDARCQSSTRGNGGRPPRDLEFRGSFVVQTSAQSQRNEFHFTPRMSRPRSRQITVARGGIISSNVFLSTAFIRLASESAGCAFDDDGGGGAGECDGEVYGFRPSSLITLIAVVSGILSAFLMPVIGAIVDYTPHRRMVGIFSALFITTVQGVQIWLTEMTWFPMAVLQAINGFMYMVSILTIFAYLPDIGRAVGPEKMTRFSALFTMCQFAAQVSEL